MFQVMPDWDKGCNYQYAQSLHPGGIFVGLGDGSVQFVNDSVSKTVWENICDPCDGAAPEAAW
jgi:hypothetical protein